MSIIFNFRKVGLGREHGCCQVLMMEIMSFKWVKVTLDKDLVFSATLCQCFVLISSAGARGSSLFHLIEEVNRKSKESTLPIVDTIMLEVALYSY